MTPRFDDVDFEPIDGGPTRHFSDDPAISFYTSGTLHLNAPALRQYFEDVDEVTLHAGKQGDQVILGIEAGSADHSRSLSTDDYSGEINAKPLIESIGIDPDGIEETQGFELESVEADTPVIAAADVTPMVQSEPDNQPTPEAQSASETEAMADGSGVEATSGSSAVGTEEATDQTDSPSEPGDDSAREIFEEATAPLGEDEVFVPPADNPNPGYHPDDSCHYITDSHEIVSIEEAVQEREASPCGVCADDDAPSPEEQTADVEPPEADELDGSDTSEDVDADSDPSEDDYPAFFDRESDPFVIVQESGVPERIGLSALLDAVICVGSFDGLQRKLSLSNSDEISAVNTALSDLGLAGERYTLVDDDVLEDRVNQIRQFTGGGAA